MSRFIEMSEVLVKKILTNEHNFFIQESEDNSDYIGLVRRIINTSCDNLYDNGISQKSVKEFSQRLFEHAKSKFVDIWVLYAEEENGEKTNLIAEKIAANKEFDDLYFE